MEKIKTLIKKKPTEFWLVLVLLFSIPSFASLLQPGYFGHHDDLQIMRIFEMDKCFKDGQIPCRWVPDMGFGYGYPLFNYYPVMPYYLGELIHFLGFSLIWSVKIDFILVFIVSAISMFFLARTFWGNLGGFMSTLLYLYAPYHSVDIYVRGAMAEAWSLAWTPLVFLFIYRVVMQGGLKNIVGLAVFLSLFLISHNPMALVFSPIMVAWALLFIIYYKKYKSIYSLVISGVWALGLAAFFTVPVLLEGKFVHLETLFIGYFNYLAHFVGLNQLFISTFWGYGGSIWGPDDGLSFQIGYLHWGAILLFLPLIYFFWKKIRINSFILIFLFLVFWFYAFLMHPRSNFIWEAVPILQNIQFPWRLLAITIFVSSLYAGSIFTLELNKKLKKLLVVITIIGIGIVYLQYFHIEKPIPLTDQQKLSGALWDLQRTAGIFDYLPKTAKFPPGGPALERIEVISGVATTSGFMRGTQSLKFSSDSTTSAVVRLPIIDFPEWRLFVDGKQTAFDNKNDLGQPTFELGPGKHEVYAKLFNTPVRIISNSISLISFTILLYFLYKLKKRK